MDTNIIILYYKRGFLSFVTRNRKPKVTGYRMVSDTHLGDRG